MFLFGVRFPIIDYEEADTTPWYSQWKGYDIKFDSSKPSDWWLVVVPDMSKGGNCSWDHNAGLKTLPLGNSRKTSWCHIALGRDPCNFSTYLDSIPCRRI